MSGFELAITLVAGLLIAIGVIGTVVPVLPGVTLVLFTMAGYGAILGFDWPGWLLMALATLAAVAGIAIGVVAPQRAATAEGVSLGGQLVGLALAVAGFFALPVIGAPLGFVAGIWLVRWRSSRDPLQAWASTRRTIRALVRAGVAQLGSALVMAALWALWVVTG